MKKWTRSWTSSFPCFYCSVDGKELKMILTIMIGGFVLGSLFVLIWSILSGAFKNVEDIKQNIIEFERNRK